MWTLLLSSALATASSAAPSNAAPAPSSALRVLGTQLQVQDARLSMLVSASLPVPAELAHAELRDHRLVVTLKQTSLGDGRSPFAATGLGGLVPTATERGEDAELELPLGNLGCAAAPRVDTASANPAVTIVRFRPIRSEIRPANGAVSAIPSVEAVTVRLARNSVIPNTCRSTGRIGCVA